MIEQIVLTALLFCTLLAHAQGTINHYVFIDMENRSQDEIFGHLPGTTDYPVTTGMHLGSPVTLTHCSATVVETDIPHQSADAVTDFNGGAMDGFQTTVGANAYCYQDGSDVPFLYFLATYYGEADHAFAPNAGPSYPSHLYLLTGTSNEVVDNLQFANNGQAAWGCLVITTSGSACNAGAYPCATPTLSGTGQIVNDAITTGTPTSYHAGICGGTCNGGSNTGLFCRDNSSCPSSTCSATGVPQGIACTSKVGDTSCVGQGTGATCQTSRCVQGSLGCNCLDSSKVTDIMTELTTAGVSHAWYCPSLADGGDLWCGPYYVTSGAWGAENTNVKSHTQLFTAINGNTLPTVSFITPPLGKSMHPNTGGGTFKDGVDWLESVVRPILNSPAYLTTAIFIWMDDWGGFYDHVPPPTPAPDNLGYGFRTPLLCVGPYCKRRIDHTQYDEAGSVLRLLVDKYSIPSLSSRDQVANSLANMLDLTQTPIPAPAPALVPSLFAKNDNVTNPDLIDGIQWLWDKLHKDKDSEKSRPKLQTRQCDPQASLRDFAKFKATGQQMEFCHNSDNSLILMPGEPAGDDEKDTEDRKPKKKHSKWLHRAAVIGSSYPIAKVADDSVDFIIGPRKSLIVGTAAFLISYELIEHQYYRKLRFW